MSKDSDLCGEDIRLWSETQSALLRRLSTGEAVADQVDWPHVVEEIDAPVRIVASGEALLAPAVTRSVIEEFARQQTTARPAQPAAVSELTPREREVFDLLAAGLSNPEICEQLVISEATAKTHVADILQKLGLHGGRSAGGRRLRLILSGRQFGLCIA